VRGGTRRPRPSGIPSAAGRCRRPAPRAAPRARTMVPHPPRLRPAVEALEDRRLLSTVYAVTTANTLIAFDSTFPARILGSPRPIRGLQGGESIRAIDVRPYTGQLYGVGSASRL